MYHPYHLLRPWKQLTTGKPYALHEPSSHRRLAGSLASLMGVEMCVLAPSTLHLFWDLFGSLSKLNVHIFMDKAAYPLAQWGVERARGRGTPIHVFGHDHLDRLERMIAARKGRRPIIVSDGWCVECARVAPIEQYLRLLEPHQGILVLDDTQALGILGQGKSARHPYGRKGGGILKWLNLKAPNVIVISSLAKGLGVPLAVMGGSKQWMQYFLTKSDTRIHNSPPGMGSIRAAENALFLNREEGDQRRRALHENIDWFRSEMHRLQIRPRGGTFPVQMLRFRNKASASQLYNHLNRANIRSVPLKSRIPEASNLGLIFRADHREREILHLISTIEQYFLKNHNRFFTKHEKTFYF